MQDRAEFWDRRTAARRWFEDEFEPVVGMLRDGDMVGGGDTEADAFMRVAGQRYRLLYTHDWNEEVLARLRDAKR